MHHNIGPGGPRWDALLRLTMYVDVHLHHATGVHTATRPTIKMTIPCTRNMHDHVASTKDGTLAEMYDSSIGRTVSGLYVLPYLCKPPPLLLLLLLRLLLLILPPRWSACCAAASWLLLALQHTRGSATGSSG